MELLSFPPSQMPPRSKITRDTLTALKAPQLQLLASQLGLASSGTKSEVGNVITQRLGQPVSFGKRGRILSIDMGIRNLGICVLEAPHLADAAASTDTKRSGKRSGPVRVTAWRRMDLIGELGQQQRNVSSPNSEDCEPPSAASRPIHPVSQFTPSNLSQTAYALISRLLATHEPDHILIERQRFRTGGASAVQEWTIRVNMLESMLWACLTTLRARASLHADMAPAQRLRSVEEVSPARVGSFWCSGLPTRVPSDLITLDSKLPDSGPSSRRVEKGDKISLARAWLDGNGDTERAASKVDLVFHTDAMQTWKGLRLDSSKGVAKETSGGKQRGTNKLDDLADCLLQGMAWVRWEENRRTLQGLLK